MVVWVYAGGGQAEMGVVPWLERHFPNVTFQRRTPQIRKPGPRPGIGVKTEVVGQTGKALDRTIRKDLQNYWQKNAADVLLLLDDTDCETPKVRNIELRTTVVETISDEERPCLVIALAVPELEVWLLADWRNTFEKDYGNCHAQMRWRLVKEGVDFEKLQEFDCRCNSTEYRKISETLRSAFEICCGTSPGYSKDTDTRRLLLQTKPDEIAKRCPEFKAFWNELNSCLHNA